jgi:hypothetical protein
VQSEGRSVWFASAAFSMPSIDERRNPVEWAFLSGCMRLQNLEGWPSRWQGGVDICRSETKPIPRAGTALRFFQHPGLKISGFFALAAAIYFLSSSL